MEGRLATGNRPCRPQAAGSSHQGGFTYLTVLAAIALLSAVLGATAEVWHTAQQREKERELLFVGHQFRLAIARYYRATPGSVKQYPATLEDLLKDPRQPGTQRYLRRIWRDPITGKPDWGLVRGPSGELQGVYSLSEAKPIKVANFDAEDMNFEVAEKYSDWIFAYRPRAPARRATPAGGSGDGVLKPAP